VLILVPLVVLGLLAGRFPKLLVLVVLPIIGGWIWYRSHYGGPDDDVTCTIATVGALLGAGVFLLAAAVSWLALRVWRKTRSSPS